MYIKIKKSNETCTHVNVYLGVKEFTVADLFDAHF